MENGRESKVKRAGRGLLLACAFCCLAFTARADDVRQYKIEAAFLYNFFNYIAWPGYQSPEDMKEAAICLYGNDPVAPYLDYIRVKREQQRKLVIRTLGNESTLEGCQILFIRSERALDMSRLRADAAAKGTLMISVSPDFVDNGGMIGLQQDGNRVAIDIDNGQLKQAGFHVSSRLLELARRVK